MREVVKVNAVIGKINDETAEISILNGKQRIFSALNDGKTVHVDTPGRGVLQVWRDSGLIRACYVNGQ